MYYPRIVDDELDQLAAELPAIAVEGPRAVGKTETSLRRAATVHRLDDGDQLAIAAADPARLARGEPPILIDEWQRLPESWDIVRRAVDADPHTPRFLLTGSAAPKLSPTHTGAGRIVSVRMRPLALAERGLCTPTVSLTQLLNGTRPAVEGAVVARARRLCRTDHRIGVPRLCAAAPSGRYAPTSTATSTASLTATSPSRATPSAAGRPLCGGWPHTPRPHRRLWRSRRSATRRPPASPTSPPR